MNQRTWIVVIAVLLLILSLGSQVVFSQDGSTAATIGPITLNGFKGDYVTATKFGAPRDVPFETDPIVINNIQIQGFMSGTLIDLSKTDPKSGCAGVFSSTPAYHFNLEYPVKTLAVTFQNEDSTTKAALVVRMPDGNFYCSGAYTNSPGVVINGDTASASVDIWIGVPFTAYADGSLSISEHDPAATEAVTEAATEAATAEMTAEATETPTPAIAVTPTRALRTLLNKSSTLTEYGGGLWTVKAPGSSITIHITLAKPVGACPVAVFVENFDKTFAASQAVTKGVTTYALPVVLSGPGTYIVQVGSNTKSTPGCAGFNDPFTLTVTAPGA